jgi:recombination protein RecA
MSSAVFSTSAAQGRPFVFEDEAEAVEANASRAALDRTAEGGCPHINLQETRIARVQSAIKNQKTKILPARVTPASQLDIRPAPEMVSSGIPALDALTGGLPRGCLTEICGPASSGRTTVLLAALAAATRRGEFCAVVDASDALDPLSAAAAGVELDRLLWVRCGEEAPKLRSRQKGCPISRASLAREVGVSPQDTFDFNRIVFKENELKGNGSRQSEHRMEQVLRATDLLLESGGFGLIALDLGDLPPQSARSIPLTTWFRFRRAVEYTPTILLALEPHSIAGSWDRWSVQCSSLIRRALICRTWICRSVILPDPATHNC